MTTPVTHVGDVPLFVEQDCRPRASEVAGHPGSFVVDFAPAYGYGVALHGTADVLRRALVAALAALEGVAPPPPLVEFIADAIADCVEGR